MNLSEQRNAERRRLILLAPLMVAANAFLFATMVVLGVVALNGGEGLGIIPSTSDANPRIVQEYLARSVPRDTYRIREWLPAEPLDASLVHGGNPSKPAADKGVAQRVKLAVYGPNGARNLDTIFWIQNGTVTRVLENDRLHAVREM